MCAFEIPKHNLIQGFFMQTFQTRRAVVSQAWLDEVTEKDGPHGMEDDAMRSLHTTMNFEAEMIDPRVLQCFESNDGKKCSQRLPNHLSLVMVRSIY
jgi:hypothetical protein